ncbi:MAG TPA: hypothetical protein VHV10_17295, partial [Ktedonobacteraceae bacterium]|nr:hypothetical protein [Ktedonobacteraceae bacterium]
MSINSKRVSNSKIMPSQPTATSPSPLHGPIPQSLSQKLLAASRIVFGLIWVVAAWLKWQP